LFCGAGGFSVGFTEAGYEVIAGVDTDDDALDTYDANHDADAINEDLTELSPAEFAETYDIYPEDVQVLIGGPPCQGFSTANVDRHVDDDRNNLVFVFAEYVDYYQPESFLMENVTGITSVDDGTLFENLLSDFRSAGYTVDHQVLNAADYGVPQKRRRMFVQGVRDGSPQWPEPTHAPVSEINTPPTTFAEVAGDD
jgi:DNA (cytosine-5)-methyltransferase 1